MTRPSVLAPVLMALAMAGCAPRPGVVPGAAGPSTPGWTGTRVVPGNNSTIAGDAAATYQQQKWSLGSRP